LASSSDAILSRYASIDIGSNSTLLLIVERKRLDGVRVLVDTKLTTKLSYGAASGNAITQAGIDRQFAALDQIQGLLANYHVAQIVVCATQVFRVAGNGPELAAEIARRYGWKIEIIEGRTEAELSYRAAATGLNEVPQERVVFDIGGGSTEIVSGCGDQINFAHSFPIGAVKLAEADALTDRVSENEMRAAISHLQTLLPAESLATVPRGGYAIAVGGTAATLAALKLGRQVFDPALIHGVILSREWLEKVTIELSALTASDRRMRLVFDPDRAEIIVAGGLILNYLVEILHCTSVTVSNRGLRWGALLERYPELAASGIKQDGGV
jgi:exopolyphosphatase / guanosine-5'-triphosphate,3'-diphosphate pyrophosphatase